MGRRLVGWYADPITVGAARYWDGRGWTDLVSWGGATSHDPTPLSEVERRAALAQTEIVTEYLDDVARRQVVAPAVAAALRLDVEQRAPRGSAATVVPARAQTSPAPEIVRPTAADPPLLPPPETSTLRELPSRPAPVVRIAVPVAPVPVAPGRVAQWWDDARSAVRSDLTLHGLAYLGVMLLFAGVTGLVVFSFGDVDPWVRALAEILVPIALFLSAWYLHRRSSAVVAAALTLLGGAISPIVVAASLTDGAPAPPDLSGRALPIVQGLLVALVAVAMVLVVRRVSSSPLRFLVGPVMWMAAGLVAGAARNPVPAGYDTARPDSFQLAVILVALAATVLLSSWSRVPASLAGATRAAALPVYSGDGINGTGTSTVLNLTVAAVPAPVVANPEPTVGSTIPVTGDGYEPNTPVEILLDVPGGTVLATVITDADGSFSTTVTLPAGALGNHSLVILGQNSAGGVASAELPIAIVTLPSTGGDPTQVANLGGLLVAAGVALMLWVNASNRRTRRCIVSR